MTGLAVSAGGIGAGDKIAGIALGGVMVFAPEMTGLSVSALNGVSMGGAIPVGRKKGSWFHKVNDRFTGVSVGLVNFTRELQERPTRPRIWWGESPHAVSCPIRTASISDAREGNDPCSART